VSCQKNTKGCLDPEATNFDVSVDESCDESAAATCRCEYPKLIFRLTHALGDTILNSNPQTINKQAFTLRSVAFFVSNIAMISTQNRAFYVSDTIRMNVKRSNTDSSNLTFRNDVQLVGKNTNTLTIGTLRSSETFKYLRITIGLNDTLKQVNFSRLASNNPFSIDTLYRKTTFDRETTRFVIWNKKTNKNITYNLDKPLTFDLPFPKDYVPKPGYDFSGINIIVDYAIWFEGINFTTDTDAMIRSKMLANTTKSFVLK
jgi:hypothetical protein